MYRAALTVISICCVTCCYGILFDGLPLHVSPSFSSQQDPVASTFCGIVRGRFGGKAFSFRGIPYALPPTGQRRWQAPIRCRTEDCWAGEYQATEFKSQCVQRSKTNFSVVVGDEDCLYLNVWTPTLNTTARLPVFVYIHGGSLQELNGNTPTYCPTEELASDTNVVYVSMNYRLQAFGFLTLPILSEHSSTKTSGNYGFMDQIAALKWVKDNILYFGGNPNQNVQPAAVLNHFRNIILFERLEFFNGSDSYAGGGLMPLVTLAGQSSGGTSILGLLASPLAKGLFHKAWIASGSPILNKTSENAGMDNADFLTKSGCQDISCLRNLTAEEVTKAVPWDKYPYWAMSDQEDLPVKGHFDGAIPVVDGYVIPEPPFDAWKNGHAIDVPLLISTTAQEPDIGPGPSDVTIGNWNWTVYKNRVNKKLDTFGTSISKMALKMYPINDTTPEYQFTSMVSDIRVNCPNDIMALYASVNSVSPVYRYVLTAQPSAPVFMSMFGDGILASYAFHSWDMFTFFGAMDDYIKNVTLSDRAYEAALKREVLSFIHNGKPYTKAWLPFPRKTALVNETITIADAYHPQECHFWLQNGFFDYAWIN